MEKRHLVAVCGIVLLTGGCAIQLPFETTPKTYKEQSESYGESPLAEFLNPVFGTGLDPEEQTRRNVSLNIEGHELIAQCMRDAGFEYSPNLSTLRVAQPDRRPNDRDWVEQYGYGFVNSPAAPPVAQPKDSWDVGKHIASLGESERKAYILALWGQAYFSQEDDPPEQSGLTWEDEGCSGKARHEVEIIRSTDITASEEFMPLFEAIAELDSDPWYLDRLNGINLEWSLCMENAGHADQTSPDNATQQIATEWSAITSLPEDDANRAALLTDLGQREIALAVADLECRETSSTLERQQALRFELESRFVADNRTALEALRAAVEQRG